MLWCPHPFTSDGHDEHVGDRRDLPMTKIQSTAIHSFFSRSPSQRKESTARQGIPSELRLSRCLRRLACVLKKYILVYLVLRVVHDFSAVRRHSPNDVRCMTCVPSGLLKRSLSGLLKAGSIIVAGVCTEHSRGMRLRTESRGRGGREDCCCFSDER